MLLFGRLAITRTPTMFYHLLMPLGEGHTAFDANTLSSGIYTASEKVWALPNLFTRVYTRLEVVWESQHEVLRSKTTSLSVYQYRLFLDGQLLGTKQMALIKN